MDYKHKCCHLDQVHVAISVSTSGLLDHKHTTQNQSPPTHPPTTPDSLRYVMLEAEREANSAPMILYFPSRLHFLINLVWFVFPNYWSKNFICITKI